MDNNERYRTPIDIAGADAFGCRPAQVKKRKAEGGSEKRCLQINRHHDAQSDRVNAHAQQHRPDKRHDDKYNLDEVEEKSEQEHNQHYRGHGSPCATRE